MNLFKIDQGKCDRDGLCAIECPRQLIELIDKDSFPSLVEGAEETCMHCGHCVAVCPHGALILTSMDLAACPPVQKELFPDPEHLKQLMLARRSIRKYQKKPVPRGVIEEIIDTARYAPSGGNKQPVHWLVIEDAAEVRHLASLVVDWSRTVSEQKTDPFFAERMKRLGTAWVAGQDRVLQGAPHVVIAHSSLEYPSAVTDCAIALSYFELAAFSRGVGACWAGYLNMAARAYPPLQEALRLPEGHQCRGALMFGYPKYGFRLIPKRDTAEITWR